MASRRKRGPAALRPWLSPGLPFSSATTIYASIRGSRQFWDLRNLDLAWAAFDSVLSRPSPAYEANLANHVLCAGDLVVHRIETFFEGPTRGLRTGTVNVGLAGRTDLPGFDPDDPWGRSGLCSSALDGTHQHVHSPFLRVIPNTLASYRLFLR